MATPTHSSDRSLRVKLVLRVEPHLWARGWSCSLVPLVELLHTVGVSPQAGLRVELLLGPRGGAAPVSSVWSCSSGWRIFQF